MGIIFGLAVLVLLFLGLWNRKKQDKKWVTEDRYDESGAWIDKRAGERGTYGSLDEEREKERQHLSRAGKTGDLLFLLQTYCMEHYPRFHTLSDEQIKKFLFFSKTQAKAFIEATGALLEGQLPDDIQEGRNETHRMSLKKRILDFSYDHFPQLLDLELDAIKRFDRLCGQLSDAVIGLAERLPEK